MNAAIPVILKLIDLAALIAQAAPGAIETYNRLKAQIDAMLADGRDPSPEEWALLDTQTAALLDEIKNA